ANTLRPFTQHIARPLHALRHLRAFTLTARPSQTSYLHSQSAPVAARQLHSHPPARLFLSAPPSASLPAPNLPIPTTRNPPGIGRRGTSTQTSLTVCGNTQFDLGPRACSRSFALEASGPRKDNAQERPPPPTLGPTPSPASAP